MTEFVAAGGEVSQSSQVMEQVMELLRERPSLPRLVLHETLGGGQRLTPMLREWIGPTFARAHEMVEASPAAKRWGPEQVPLLVLAMYHIVIGYFTIAPLYKDLNGHDLMAEESLQRQTRFLAKVVASLFTAEAPR